MSFTIFERSVMVEVTRKAHSAVAAGASAVAAFMSAVRFAERPQSLGMASLCGFVRKSLGGDTLDAAAVAIQLLRLVRWQPWLQRFDLY